MAYRNWYVNGAPVSVHHMHVIWQHLWKFCMPKDNTKFQMVKDELMHTLCASFNNTKWAAVQTSAPFITVTAVVLQFSFFIINMIPIWLILYCAT
jgi:hypothetical protein